MAYSILIFIRLCFHTISLFLESPQLKIRKSFKSISFIFIIIENSLHNIFLFWYLLRLSCSIRSFMGIVLFVFLCLVEFWSQFSVKDEGLTFKFCFEHFFIFEWYTLNWNETISFRFKKTLFISEEFLEISKFKAKFWKCCPLLATAIRFSFFCFFCQLFCGLLTFASV